MCVQFEDKSSACKFILKYMSFGDEQFSETVSGYCSMAGFCDDKDSSAGFMVAECRVISSKLSMPEVIKLRFLSLKIWTP
jgi:hypothetical protein